MTRMTGARLIADSLVRHGIKAVAGIPGGANLPLFDAISQTPTRIVLARQTPDLGRTQVHFPRAGYVVGKA